MIALETTWQYIVMLLVAGGVGAVGGVGAALIEGKTKLAANPPEKGNWLLDSVACVVLGGIAAIAVLYFFLPTKEIVPAGGGKPEQFYELIKLVPLSLIVGSAGTVFLQNFQQRVGDALAAQRGREAEAKTKATLGITEGLPEQTDKSLEGAQPNFQVILQKAAGLGPDKADEVAAQLVEEAKKAAGEVIQPQVQAGPGRRRRRRAAAADTGTGAARRAAAPRLASPSRGGAQAA